MNFENLEKNLVSKGYKVSQFSNAKEAAEYLVKEIKNTTVGIGGSVTFQEMNLYDMLSADNQVYWHWRLPEGKTQKEIRALASGTEVYISSVNAIAETGEIVNIDGNGNRVASIMYGHERVYLVVGCNKIEKDFEKALFRAKNIASPLNAKRMKRKTPCAEKGDKCYDCRSPERICRELSVLMAKPGTGRYEVILIDEKLGY